MLNVSIDTPVSAWQDSRRFLANDFVSDRWFVFSMRTLFLQLLLSFVVLPGGLDLPIGLLAQEESSTTEEFPEIAPPPVTRIVMFNSGLSQIVHEGTIDGNKRVGMAFSAHDVDDVLKSLVFEDRDGGLVRSVEYKPAPDNQDVAARNLGPPMTLAQTLQKYRGETVEIVTENATIKGEILSVENRQIADEFYETLTVVNDRGFVSLSLNEFESIQFENEKLREEFKLAMAGLQKSRSADLKQLNLLFEGKGKRNVRYSYNVDAPIWRMTYRLDLNPERSTLQGWAHIDNVTGVDWNQIQLDLRSGRPQSFHVELFAPVLAERTSFDLGIFDIPSDKTLITQYFGFDPPDRLENDFGGISPESHPWRGGLGGGGFGGGGAGGSGGSGGFGGGSLSGKRQPMDINSAIADAAQSGRSNKMVQFLIAEPVSLAAGRSAMVPVLTEELPVNLYSMFAGQKSVNGARLVAQIKNTAATPLIPGPVTLYKNGDFVGDGVLERIETGETREMSYGDDLAVAMNVKALPVKTVASSVSMLPEGNVRIRFNQTSTTEFELVNEDSLERDFLLKLAMTSDKVTPEPDRIAKDIGEYKLNCEPNASVKHVVSQESQTTKKMRLSQIVQKDINGWRRDGAEIANDLIEKMESIFQARNQVSELKAKYDAAVEVRTLASNEQKRLTEIIRVLKSDSPTAETYLKKLSESEGELEQASIRVRDLAKQVAEAETKLEKLYE